MKITDKINLTCEDNMELMARYPDNYFELAIVDPPYGISENSNRLNKPKKAAAKKKIYHTALWEQSKPSKEYFEELKRVSKNQIIWGEIRIHPTQKPVKLYEWLLMNYAKEGDKILDTHLGSMSIAIACHNLGFELTGCELDQEYYEQGIKRLKNHIAQQRLF